MAALFISIDNYKYKHFNFNSKLCSTWRYVRWELFVLHDGMSGESFLFYM